MAESLPWQRAQARQIKVGTGDDADWIDYADPYYWQAGQKRFNTPEEAQAMFRDTQDLWQTQMRDNPNLANPYPAHLLDPNMQWNDPRVTPWFGVDPQTGIYQGMQQQPYATDPNFGFKNALLATAGAFAGPFLGPAGLNLLSPLQATLAGGAIRGGLSGGAEGALKGLATSGLTSFAGDLFGGGNVPFEELEGALEPGALEAASNFGGSGGGSDFLAGLENSFATSQANPLDSGSWFNLAQGPTDFGGPGSDAGTLGLFGPSAGGGLLSPETGLPSDFSQALLPSSDTGMFGAGSGVTDTFGGLVPGGLDAGIAGFQGDNLFGGGGLDFLNVNDPLTGAWIPGTGSEAPAGVGGGNSGMDINDDGTLDVGYTSEGKNAMEVASNFKDKDTLVGLIQKYGIDPIKEFTGLSDAQLAILTGGLVGAFTGNRTAGKQQDTFQQLIDAGGPARAKLNETIAELPSLRDPEPYDFDALLNEAADRRARMWSEKVGNPVLSPQARISTEQDLARLKEELRGNRLSQENQRIAALTNPGFVSLGSGASGVAGAQGRAGDAVSGGIGTVFDSIFNPQGGTSSGADQLISLINRYPWLFMGRP